MKKSVRSYRFLLMGILCLSTFCMLFASNSSLMPAGDQVKDSLIHLIYADVMYKTPMDPKATILVKKSNKQVQLYHDGITLICDSARYMKEDNSFRGFGHVKMLQGDTLSLVSDTLDYDGYSQYAKARGHCVLTHRASKLVSDKLDYDRSVGVGTYFDGGTLYDSGNTLNSYNGQYTPATRESIFRNSVILLSNKKDTLETNELFYYTNSKRAYVQDSTWIHLSDGTMIFAMKGDYNTNTGNSHVYDKRSHIYKDMRDIQGDSLRSDKKSGLYEAFGNVILTDEENKCMLTGDYCSYNQNTGEAVATDRAVAYEYSQKDTLYVHADTLRMFSFNINTDSAYHDMHAYHKVRAYRIDVQAVCDSMVTHELDSCTYMYGQPILWNDKEQIFGEEIRLYNNDSTIDWAHIINQAMTIERLDSVSYNQVSSKEMFAYFKNGEIDHNVAKGNVYVDYYMDEDDGSRIGMDYTETTELRVFMENKKVQTIWMPGGKGTMYPPFAIPADKLYLTGFAWFDYIRPLNKDDIFEWRSKGDKYILKKSEKKVVPIQNLNNIKGVTKS